MSVVDGYWYASLHLLLPFGLFDPRHQFPFLPFSRTPRLQILILFTRPAQTKTFPPRKNFSIFLIQQWREVSTKESLNTQGLPLVMVAMSPYSTCLPFFTYLSAVFVRRWASTSINSLSAACWFCHSVEMQVAQITQINPPHPSPGSDRIESVTLAQQFMLFRRVMPHCN